MLTLARKVNEAIIVNDNIEITILDVKGDQIKVCPSTARNYMIRFRKQMRRLSIRPVHRL